MKGTHTIVTALAVVLMTSGVGCYPYEEPGAVGVETYTPDYYEGNVVYFDNDRPYYFVGDEVRYVPQDRPEYDQFREHHRRSGPAYRHWEMSHAHPHHRGAGVEEHR